MVTLIWPCNLSVLPSYHPFIMAALALWAYVQTNNVFAYFANSIQYLNSLCVIPKFFGSMAVGFLKEIKLICRLVLVAIHIANITTARAYHETDDANLTHLFTPLFIIHPWKL